MAASTAWARRSAPAGLRLGASREGDFTSPASIAASADLHLARRLAEIALRGGLDAVGAGAEIDAVEIELENLVLAELALEPEREHQLLHLAPERALLGQEQVLGELLGEGGAALRHAAAKHVGDHGAGEPDRVDAEMAVEPAILDRDERLRQVGGKLLDRHIRAAHLAAQDERPAVGPDDLDRRRPFRHFERLDRRQRRDHEGDRPDRGDHRPQAEHQRPVEQAPQRASRRLRRVCGRARMPGGCRERLRPSLPEPGRPRHSRRAFFPAMPRPLVTPGDGRERDLKGGYCCGGFRKDGGAALSRSHGRARTVTID